jgi:hypothetical protein
MQGSRVDSKILLFVITLFVSFYSYAGEKKIYAWKDEGGVLVFSDTPLAGAKEIRLTSQDLTIPTTQADIADNQAQAITFNIRISSPENQQTIRENTGSVYVTTRVTPRFEKDFTIELFFDGVSQGPASEMSTFALRNVERGEHMLQVKLYNQQNQAIAISPPSIFYMHRKGLSLDN